MRKDRECAISLRLRGHSYSEIKTKLGVPKSTLSGWLSGIVLSDKARTRIEKRTRVASLRGLMKKNKIQTHQALERVKNIHQQTRSEICPLSQKELLLIGTALYWAEGYKRPITRNGRERTCHSISFSNSDPKMIKLFLDFLYRILKISKHRIKVSIRLYEHMNEQKTINFWRKTTGLPKNNFLKTYYGVSRSSLGKKPYNVLQYGTVQIRVGDTHNFHKIMGWIEGLENQY